MTATGGSGDGGGRKSDRGKKFQVIALEHARRRKQQLRATSGGDGGGSGTPDYHNQLYKLTESVQLLDEKVVHMERMLRKLLRLLRNSGGGGGGQSST